MSEVDDAEYRVFLVPHTHWDRAWYLTFEEFRAGLIPLFERVSSFLSKEENPPFFLDGQTIVLEDYLDLKPGQFAPLQRLVKNGRLSVGPQYVQIDQMLAHPEALIRNFLLGDHDGKKLGPVCKIGYFPDTWGIPSQMPQILQAFEIKGMVLGRGYKEDLRENGLEFRWRGIDGTDVVAVLMPKGYVNGINLGCPIKWGDTTSVPYKSEEAIRELTEEAEFQRSLSFSGNALIMNGGDHAFPDARVYDTLRSAPRIPGVEIDTGGLPGYVNRLLENRSSLKVYEGQFKYGRYSYVVSGTRTTRMYLKQANVRISKRLVNCIEPLLSYAGIAGRSIDRVLLERAWRLLLQNLAHDEIGGCGIDAVHREMMCRFSKAESIAGVIRRFSQRVIGENLALEESDLPAHVIFNPSNGEIDSLVRTTLVVDDRNAEHPGVEVFDHRGAPLAFQVLSRRPRFSMEINSGRKRSEWDVVLKSPRLAPFGFHAVRTGTKWIREDLPSAAGTEVASVRFENPFFVLEVSAKDVSLTQKSTGKVYKDFVALTDEEDAGDEYNFSPLPAHREIGTRAVHGRVLRVHDGPLFFHCLKEMTLMVPRSLDWGRRARSESMVGVPVVLGFSVLADSPVLEMNVMIDNTAEQHRMRAVFSFDDVDFSRQVKGSHFCYETCADREAAIDDSNWKEPLTPTQPFRDFVLFPDGKECLAIFCHDSTEYETSGKGEAAFTLFRAVGDLSRDDLSTRKGGAGFTFSTPDAQCPGVFEARFGLVVSPQSSDPWDVARAAEAFLNPPFAFPVSDPQGLLPGDVVHPDLPVSFPVAAPHRSDLFGVPHSAFSIQPREIMVTAFKPFGDTEGYLLRLLNDSPKVLQASLRVFGSVVRISTVGMNEELIQDLAFDSEGRVTLDFLPFQIKGVVVFVTKRSNA